MELLNITNGDAALQVMRAAGIPGDLIAWHDVLHEGPVPEGLDLESLSATRVAYLVAQGWDRAAKAADQFRRRDASLCASGSYRQVRLWFEHDLYDQLQLLQILAWWFGNGSPATRLTLICSERYLGPSTPAELTALLAQEHEVSVAELKLAQRAWSAFRASQPEAWVALLQDDLSPLPFLRGTVGRLLEEYPAEESGLSRIERVILQLLQSQPQTPSQLFSAYQQSESRRFLGDIVFAERLKAFLRAATPLIGIDGASGFEWPGAGPEPTLTITTEGEQVLSGKLCWLEIEPPDRWIGGVHLTPCSLWYWRPSQARLVPGKVSL